jgi:hypothetical protein
VSATARPDLILLPFVSWCGDAAIGELLFVTGSGGAVGALGGAGHLVTGARGVGGTPGGASHLVDGYGGARGALGGADHLVVGA